MKLIRTIGMVFATALASPVAAQSGAEPPACAREYTSMGWELTVDVGSAYGLTPTFSRRFYHPNSGLRLSMSMSQETGPSYSYNIHDFLDVPEVESALAPYQPEPSNTADLSIVESWQRGADPYQGTAQLTIRNSESDWRWILNGPLVRDFSPLSRKNEYFIEVDESPDVRDLIAYLANEVRHSMYVMMEFTPTDGTLELVRLRYFSSEGLVDLLNRDQEISMDLAATCPLLQRRD